MEFEIDKNLKKSGPFRTTEMSGKAYYVNTKVKARHMVTIENLYGTKLGDVEKGLRILALLLYEAMGTEALKYDEMLEYDLDELEPLLSLVAG